MEVLHSSETSVLTRATWRTIPETSTPTGFKVTYWCIMPSIATSLTRLKAVLSNYGLLEVNWNPSLIRLKRWYITLRITGFWGFVHCMAFKKHRRTQHFGKWIFFTHSWRVRNTYSDWRMASSGMLHHVALVRTDVSEELSASFIRVTRIGELRAVLAVTSNRCMPHSVTSQKTPFFIVTPLKTSNLTCTQIGLNYLATSMLYHNS
jgi:hypothetical protein